MSKVLTFSRTYPAYHPRKGEPTYFVEKLHNSFYTDCHPPYEDMLEALNPNFKNGVADFLATMNGDIQYIKHHTIRAGNRFKVGDRFSPRVWSGKPYQSKQIIIAPDMEVKKVWPIEIKNKQFIITTSEAHEWRLQSDSFILKKLAANDGLTLPELLEWFKFPKDFKGQIICWNDTVNY